METMANSMMEASGILGTATSAGSERETAKRCSAIVEHQGGTRILHQPDGTIVCEPAAMSFSSSGASGPVIGERHCGLELARCAAGRAVQLGMLTCQAAVIVGSAVGGWTSVLHVSHAMCQNQPVNVKRMAGDAAAAVGCCVAATLGGVVAGPVVAAGSALRLAVRPALLAGAVHCSWGWLRRHHVGAAALLRKLQSGELSKQLEALREVVARAATNPAFRQEWAKLSGVEAVLQLLARALATAQAGASLLGSPQAPLAARALAELAVDGDAVDTIVEAGGVSLLVKAAQLGFEGGMPTTTAASAAAGASTLLMLDAANLLMTDKLPSVSCDGSSGGAKAAQAAPSHVPLVVHALHALSRVASSHAVAQQLLASEPGAGPLLAGVLRAATAGLLLGGSPAACAALRGDVICLMHALALEPAGKASLGDAGAVEALAAALTLSTPWSHDQADAAAALHAVVRGDPANQRRLAAAAAAGVSAAISRTLNMSPAVAAASAANSPMARSSHNDTFAADAPVLGSAAAAGGKAAARQRGSRAHSPPTGSSMLLAGPMVHAARADLVALSHVIARYTPPTLSAPVTTAAAPPPATVAAAAAAAAAPTRTAFLQRLRLRTSRPPAAPAAAAAAAAPIVAPVSSTRAPSSPLTRTPANSSTRRSSMTEAAGTVLPAAAVEDAAAGAAAAVLPAAADERADNHTTSDQEWEDDVCVGDSAESSENERAASPELPLRVQ